MAAIPAIAMLEHLAKQARAKGNEQAAMYWYDRLYVLIALYRIAEDMGYEW
jgi:ABC-type transporter Mla MlaB component